MENFCNSIFIVALPISFVMNLFFLVLLCRQKPTKKDSAPIQDIIYNANESSYSPFPNSLHTPPQITGVPIAFP